MMDHWTARSPWSPGPVAASAGPLPRSSAAVARVWFSTTSTRPSATQTCKDLQQQGIRSVGVAGDITAPDMGDRLVATATEELGGLDIIVNNAGYTWDGVIARMPDEQFQAMLDVHLLAPFRILRAAAPWFRETGPAGRCRRPADLPEGGQHLLRGRYRW